MFALVASAMAARPAAGRWTFGYSRLEILAAQANGITLGLIALWVIWSAVHRLVDPHDVRGGLVLTVALGGVAVSVAASIVLARASRESLNVRGAFLHVLDGRRGVRCRGSCRRPHPRDRLGPLRPDREPRCRGADALVERPAPA